MKKIFLLIILNVSVLSLISCKSKKEPSIMIASSYDGDDSSLYWAIQSANGDIKFELIRKNYKYIKDRVSYKKIKQLTNHVNHCDIFKNNTRVSKVIHLAKEKKVRLLILAFPDKVKPNSKKVNIHYKAIDLENQCKIYKFKNYHTYISMVGVDKPALKKIVNEIEEIINKLD